MKTSEPSPQSDLLPMELEKSTSSAAGFRAKMSALPEEKLALLMEREAASIQKSFDLLTKYDPNSSSWRTSQTCFLALANNQEDGLGQFSETWPRSGMMRNGIAYQLPTLGPGIVGTEYGFLPTPTKSADSKGSPKGRYFGSGTCFSNLREVLRNGPDDPVFPNPLLVEEMMGFPKSHTELQPSEMPLSRKSRK